VYRYITASKLTGMGGRSSVALAANVMGCWENCHELTTPYGSFVAAHWRVYMFASTTTERYIAHHDTTRDDRPRSTRTWRRSNVSPARITAAATEIESGTERGLSIYI
jgi:hypothetical protein